MRKDLEPRLARTGDQALLEPFLDFFKDKPLSNGSTILSIWESACPSAPTAEASFYTGSPCMPAASTRQALTSRLLAGDNASLEGTLFPPGFTDYEHADVPVGLVNENFCRAMFDLYWGPDCVVPDARRQWADAAVELLKS